MPNQYAYATYQTQIGMGKETTRSQAIAPAYWAKVKGPKYKPEPAIIKDDTLQGSAVMLYNQQLGLRYDSHAWDGYPYLDSFGAYLLGELGYEQLVAAPSNTTVATAAAAGATTLITAASVATGSWITIGTGATIEARYVLTGGSTTLTLEVPLTYAHATGETVTGLTKHNFALLNSAGSTGNQPPSYTLVDFDGEEWRQLTGCQLDKLTIKGQGTNWVDFSVNWFGDPATTISAPTPNFTTTQAPPGWTTGILIGGTYVKYVEDWEIDLSRAVKPIPALQGTQGYYEYFAGPIQATAKLTIVEQSGSPQLTNFLNASQQSLNISVFDRSSGFGMRMLSTVSAWESGELVRSKEWVEVTVSATLLPSSTDAIGSAGGVSPIQISLGNAQSTVY